MNRLLDRYFTRYSEAFQFFYFYGPYLQGSYGGSDLLKASILSLNHLGEILQTPEPGLHCNTAANPDLLVVCDDINLPLGKLRIRKSGSAGGQKGLANIIQHLGTEAVPRLRIGVDLPPENRDAADYVLDRFSKAEAKVIRETIGRAADAVETWLREGLDAAMNRFNAAEKPDSA